MNLRNLEQIQEQDPRHRPFPLGTLVLSAIAGGALVVAAMTTLAPEREPQRSSSDALDRLLAEQDPGLPPSVVSPSQVTFPGVLSDRDTPTTALAVVRDEQGRLLNAPVGTAEAHAENEGSGLPPSVLPAGDLLSVTPATQDSTDDLTQLTRERVQAGEDGQEELAPPGQQGGFEIQVASFQDKDDADGFVGELRKRGHRAYRQAAYVPNRGLWHRVRVGSFKSRYEAERYQRKLEKSERLSTFLVDPEKMKRQKTIRDAKEQAEKKKSEKRQLVTAR